MQFKGLSRFIGPLLTVVICLSSTVAPSEAKVKHKAQHQHIHQNANAPAFEQLNQQHLALIRLNAAERRDRRVDAARPLPNGFSIATPEQIQEVLRLDRKNLLALSNKKVPEDSLPTPNVISKNKCMFHQFDHVRWFFCLTDTAAKGLWISNVYIQRSPPEVFRKVIGSAGLAEIYTPYHDIDFRPSDLNEWVTRLNQVGNVEAGSGSTIVLAPDETVPTVVIEERDRGVGLLCHQEYQGTSYNIIKRSKELVVWGVSDAGNYDNIIQYSFRDDGVITFRMGQTGYGYPGLWDNAKPSTQYTYPEYQRLNHTHNGLWRVDIDVNGSGSDTAYLHRHIETTTPHEQFTKAYLEDKFPLVGGQFTGLRVSDTEQNIESQPMSYEFVPSYNGISRHWRTADEKWTRNDIHVTKFHWGELGWMAKVGSDLNTAFEYVNGSGVTDPDTFLLQQQMIPRENIANSDLVVWLKTSFHHTPTTEENQAIAIPNAIGTVAVHWSGFDLMPNNFFNENPLSPGTTCNHPQPPP
jgi:primary-amine oxidase